MKPVESNGIRQKKTETKKKRNGWVKGSMKKPKASIFSNRNNTFIKKFSNGSLYLSHSLALTLSLCVCVPLCITLIRT